MYENILWNSHEDFIEGKMKDISPLHIGNKHHTAWRGIQELSGKSSKPSTRIKGGPVRRESLAGMTISKTF